MKKTALVRLTTDERAQLQHLLKVGQAATRQLTHARVLLKADEGADGPAWPDKRIAEARDVAPITVGRVLSTWDHALLTCNTCSMNSDAAPAPYAG